MNLPKTHGLIQGLWKETIRYFTKPKVYLSSFQNCFWNLFNTSDLSEICKIRNVWKPLDLLDNFSSKMMFLNSKMSFQSLRSEYSLWTDLEVSKHLLFYRFQTNQKCSKDFKNKFENKTQNQRTTYTLVFVKYLLVCFRSPWIRACSVFLEDSLRIISETWRAGKNLTTQS
jgi:hypothetical protein